MTPADPPVEPTAETPEQAPPAPGVNAAPPDSSDSGPAEDVAVPGAAPESEDAEETAASAEAESIGGSPEEPAGVSQDAESLGASPEEPSGTSQEAESPDTAAADAESAPASADTTGGASAEAASPAAVSASAATTSPVFSSIGRTAAEIAEAVRSGLADPRAVVAEHLERITALGPALDAFRRVRSRAALEEAEALARRPDLDRLPLAGVPVAIKDNVEVQGEQLRNGSAASPETTAEADHPVVARLREAGAIVVGLTNVPELCLMPVSDSAFGIARNPWNRSRTPGGSSGGSAAAVAAALVPLAHGNDGLGSIRIPASCCGLVGIKPGRGVVPATADGSEFWYGMAENGPLATTVQDAALALSVMAADPALAVLDEPERPLRIGVSVRPPQAGLPIDPACAKAAQEAGDALAGLGHAVAGHFRRYPAWLGPATLRTWYACAAEDAAELDPSLLQRRTRRMAALGRVVTAAHADGARSREKWRGGAAEAFFGDVDVLVLPALAAPPPPAARWGDRGALRNTLMSMKVASLLGAWNVAGWPAMSVPGGIHPDGTPLGVQLVARPGHENTLLRLAAQLERLRPWPRHAPDYR